MASDVTIELLVGVLTSRDTFQLEGTKNNHISHTNSNHCAENRKLKMRKK